jgi:hypothetical protein
MYPIIPSLKRCFRKQSHLTALRVAGTKRIALINNELTERQKMKKRGTPNMKVSLTICMKTKGNFFGISILKRCV